ncbi:MAG: hypothetical protein J2P29_05885 [Actinobacteria bacterium]|nr:hypothetical protein [Actinomycetota bacterium]MBO0831484.1 hypothetical protein [Actinomycetota bacterium]
MLRQAWQRLAPFTGLHFTPADWLHMATLVAGHADQFSGQRAPRCRWWLRSKGAGSVLPARASGTTISTYAGNGWTLPTAGNGGPAVNAGLNTPEGEVFDANGDVIIADSANNRIQEIAATTHTQWGVPM